MGKLRIIKPRFVKFVPERLEEGVIYISQEYRTAVHKCACGCGQEVVTPLLPTDWSLYVNGKYVSLHPSIGNWTFSCRSHYWIRNNRISWAGDMTQAQIDRGRILDRRHKDAYFRRPNTHQNQHQVSVFNRFKAWLNRLLGK